jgi:hypothetical protein
MTKAITKRPRGRPATGVGILIGTRWRAATVHAIDRWRRQQPDKPGRTEAVRRLVDMALEGMPPTKQRSPQARSKAHDLASNQIDRLSDPSATDDERQQRKRRLLKGPKEFQEIRDDIHSKSKS